MELDSALAAPLAQPSTETSAASERAAGPVSRSLSRPVFAAGTLVLASLVLVLFVQVSSLGENPRAALSALIDGTASRPFVYRRLVPASARLLLAVTPAGLEASLGEALRASQPWGALLSHMHLGERDYVKGVYCLGLMLASLVAQAYAFRALFAASYGRGRRADLAAIWGVLCAVPFFEYGYIYDFTTLLLSTLSWLCLVQRSWRWFAVVYLVGCLNKETVILVSLAFAITQYGRVPRSAYWGWLGFQLGAFALVRWALVHAYSANPGLDFEWHAHDHWIALSWAWPALTSAAWIANLARLVGRDWARKPVVLRGILGAVLPPMVVLFVLFGYPYEWRVFYEILPVVVLLAGPARQEQRVAG